MNNTTKNYETLVDMIENLNLTAEEIVQLFTNYHGMQLIEDDFIEFVNNEYDC